MRFVSSVLGAIMLVGLIACGDGSKVISEGKMIDVVADLEVAESYAQTKGVHDNVEKDRIINSVFAKNGISREEFDSTLNWYGANMDKYYELLSKVDKELASRQSDISGKIETQSGDDLWPYSRHYMFDKNQKTQNMRFSIEPSSLAKGERLVWKMRFRNPVNGNALLGVEYEDGSKSFSTMPVSYLSKMEVELMTDTAVKVKRVFGNFRLASDMTNRVLADSVSLLKHPLDTTRYYQYSIQPRYRGPRKRPVAGAVSKDSMSQATDGGLNLPVRPVNARTSIRRPGARQTVGTTPAVR